MISGFSESLPQGIWPVFVGICFLGAIAGLLGGAGHLPDLVFWICLVAVPTIFIAWAVTKLDPNDLMKITKQGDGRDA